MQPQDGVCHDWQGLKASLWSPQTKPCWLQGLIPDRLCLPLLPSHFSTASTAAQIQQLITLYVLPVVPLKHNIKSLGDLDKLPSPALTGKHPRLPTARIPKTQCLVPGKLLVRKLPSLAFMESTGYWNLTLQISGSSCSMKLVRLHALICHARHAPPKACGHAPVWRQGLGFRGGLGVRV